MDRGSHDATVIHSSISLLQERFRQLQRVKARREEKEISKMLALSAESEPKKFTMINSKPTMHHKLPKPAARTRLFFHPDHHLVHGPAHGHDSSASGVSLSLWPTVKSKHDDYIPRSIDQTPMLIDLWPSVTAEAPSLDTSATKLEHSADCDSDVDTSLHL